MILKFFAARWYSVFIKIDALLNEQQLFDAEVAKLVYAPDLGSGAERHTSSSLVLGTIFIYSESFITSHRYY